MYQWQNLLNNGNECFNEQNWLQAEYYYKQAESHLDILWSANNKDVDLLMAWICTVHNLATLFEAQGNNEVSLQYLLIPHHRMLKLSHNDQSCEDLKLIAMKALKFTFTPLMIFAKKHPMCADCENGLNEFQKRLDAQQPQLH